MTRDELVKKLRDLKREELLIHSENGYRNSSDFHSEADEALIEYIGDSEVGDLFESLERWYGCYRLD